MVAPPIAIFGGVVDTVTGTLANARTCFPRIILRINVTRLFLAVDTGDVKKHGDVIFILLHV